MMIMYGLAGVSFVMILVGSSLFLKDVLKKEQIKIAEDVGTIVLGVVLLNVSGYYIDLIEERGVVESKLEEGEEGYVEEKTVRVTSEQLVKKESGHYVVSKFKKDEQGVWSDEELWIHTDDVDVSEGDKWTLVYQEIDEKVEEKIEDLDRKMWFLFESDLYYLRQEGYFNAKVVSENG